MSVHQVSDYKFDYTDTYSVLCRRYGIQERASKAASAALGDSASSPEAAVNVHILPLPEKPFLRPTDNSREDLKFLRQQMDYYDLNDESIRKEFEGLLFQCHELAEEPLFQEITCILKRIPSVSYVAYLLRQLEVAMDIHGLEDSENFADLAGQVLIVIQETNLQDRKDLQDKLFFYLGLAEKLENAREDESLFILYNIGFRVKQHWIECQKGDDVEDLSKRQGELRESFAVATKRLEEEFESFKTKLASVKRKLASFDETNDPGGHRRKKWTRRQQVLIEHREELIYLVDRLGYCERDLDLATATLKVRRAASQAGITGSVSSPQGQGTESSDSHSVDSDADHSRTSPAPLDEQDDYKVRERDVRILPPLGIQNGGIGISSNDCFINALFQAGIAPFPEVIEKLKFLSETDDDQVLAAWYAMAQTYVEDQQHPTIVKYFESYDCREDVRYRTRYSSSFVRIELCDRFKNLSLTSQEDVDLIASHLFGKILSQPPVGIDEVSTYDIGEAQPIVVDGAAVEIDREKGLMTRSKTERQDYGKRTVRIEKDVPIQTLFERELIDRSPADFRMDCMLDGSLVEAAFQRTKRHIFYRDAPPILILNMSRYRGQLHETNMRWSRSQQKMIDDRWQFIQLPPSSDGTPNYRWPTEDGELIPFEPYWENVKIDDPIEVLSKELYIPKENMRSGKQANYELRSIIVHLGEEAESGHYVAYVSVPGTGWFLCDDEIVRPVTEEEALAAAKSGYQLFYEYRGSRSVSPPEELD